MDPFLVSLHFFPGFRRQWEIIVILIIILSMTGSNSSSTATTLQPTSAMFQSRLLGCTDRHGELKPKKSSKDHKLAKKKTVTEQIYSLYESLKKSSELLDECQFELAEKFCQCALEMNADRPTAGPEDVRHPWAGAWRGEELPRARHHHTRFISLDLQTGPLIADFFRSSCGVLIASLLQLDHQEGQLYYNHINISIMDILSSVLVFITISERYLVNKQFCCRCPCSSFKSSRFNAASNDPLLQLYSISGDRRHRTS